MRILMRGALSAFRARLLKLVDGLKAGDVARARTELETAIQAQRDLPGTLRRWLCADIRRIDGRNVDEWKQRVRDALRLD
jgi:hypothetical protein